MKLSPKFLLSLMFLFVGLIGHSQLVDIHKQVSPTKYDYTEVARQITQGCTTKYEQAKAIYRWLCANISYDTTYSIYTADECWEKRRGVCQAYSELFYRLAEPLGIDVRMVTGTSKTLDDAAGEHAWVFVVVEGESTGILVDATWGAGSVNGNTFTRNDNDMSWFHVDPYWMIFTHYPDDAAYQLLPQPISRQQFDALPIVKPMWAEYGFNARKIFKQCLTGQSDLPDMYNEGRGYVRMADVPLNRELKIGHKYTFAIQKTRDCEVALINTDFYTDWNCQNGVCYMEFIPAKTGKAKISIRKKGEKQYWTVMSYEVPQPTRADLALLERNAPLLMPEITRLKNANINDLKRWSISGEKLLKAVRSGKVTALPTFYRSDGKCTIDEMPFNATLRVGETYTFQIRPHNGLKWAVINEGDWYQTWNADPQTGAWTLTVTPQKVGRLSLSVQMKEGGSYSSCIGYQVK